MPKSCCVPRCTNNKHKNPNLKFYIIPSERTRRNKCLSAINRASLNADGTVNRNKVWSPPSAHSYVCSSHFISGAKVNDPTHPDSVPSLFPSDENSDNCAKFLLKSSKKMDRYKGVMKRRMSTNEGTQPSQVRKKLKLSESPLTIPSDRTTNWSDLVSTPTKDDSLFDDRSPLPTLFSPPDKSSVSDASPAKCPETMSDVKETPMRRTLDPSEREMLYTEISNLRRERDEALAKISCLEKLISASLLSSSSVEGNDDACQTMTGISWGVFLKLFLFFVYICK